MGLGTYGPFVWAKRFGWRQDILAMAQQVGTDFGLVDAEWRIAHTKEESHGSSSRTALTGTLPKRDSQRQKVARRSFWRGVRAMIG